jgi:integrase
MGNYGLGGVFKVGDLWHVRYSSNGSQIRESTHIRISGPEGSPEFQKSENKARQFLRRRLDEIAAGNFAPKQNRLTLDECLDAYLAAYKLRGGRALRTTELVLRHVRKYFAGYRAPHVNGKKLRAYVLHRKEQGAADASVHRELAHLRASLTLAVRDEQLSKVPDFPVIKLNNARQGFIKPADFTRLRAECRTELLQDFATFLYWSGWRSNEAKTLEWKDIDLAESCIRLRSENSKTRQRRKLKLFGELKEMIARRVARRCPDSPFVFCRKDGRALGCVADAWKAAALRAGLGHITPHDCRRSAIRNLIRAGVPTSVAMEWSGHKSFTTFKRYDITADDDMDEAADKVAAYVAAEQAKVPAKVLTLQIPAKEQRSKIQADDAITAVKSA